MSTHPFILENTAESLYVDGTTIPNNKFMLPALKYGSSTCLYFHVCIGIYWFEVFTVYEINGISLSANILSVLKQKILSINSRLKRRLVTRKCKINCVHFQ